MTYNCICINRLFIDIKSIALQAILMMKSVILKKNVDEISSGSEYTQFRMIFSAKNDLPVNSLMNPESRTHNQPTSLIDYFGFSKLTNSNRDTHNCVCTISERLLQPQIVEKQ